MPGDLLASRKSAKKGNDMRMKIKNRVALATLSILYVLLAALDPASAAPLTVIKDVEWQPFAAQVKRLIEATDYLGSPFNAKETKALEVALNATDTQAAS